MPIYEMKCPQGHKTDARRRMKNRDEPYVCECGLPAERIISPANHSVGWRMSEKFYLTPGMSDKEGLVRDLA